MKYIDLHCDALTQEGVLQVTGETLRAGGCALQCFAAFVKEGEGISRALALCDGFALLCKEEGFAPYTGGELCAGVNAMLTVEGGHALGGEISSLDLLYARGVRMMTLTWNFPNELGAPNFAPDRFGSPFRRERERGLTPFGREVVEKMCGKMIPDVSHGSDKLLLDVADICGRRGVPFAASHSGAAAVYPHARNLTDEGIRLIAESGGAVGLNFCTAFLSEDNSEEGQREALLAHAEHILNAGGEDVLALGSDFDGAPPNPCIKSPADVPAFSETLIKKFGERVAEKILFENALRLLQTLEQ